MGVLEDVRNWLKEYPLWQELEKIPRRTDEIEARVSALEKILERVPVMPVLNAAPAQCALQSRAGAWEAKMLIVSTIGPAQILPAATPNNAGCCCEWILARVL